MEIRHTGTRIVKKRPYSNMSNPVGWYDCYMMFVGKLYQQREERKKKVNDLKV